MKNIPTLRRHHPRPPAIQTTSLDKIERCARASSAPPTPTPRIPIEPVHVPTYTPHSRTPELHLPSGSGQDVPRGASPMSLSPDADAAGKTPHSPFRSLRLKSLSGRGRLSPSESTTTTPPPASARHFDFFSSRFSAKADVAEKNHHPDLPWFLGQSRQEIDSRFQDILWEERTRVAKAEQCGESPEYRYSVYQNTALPPRMNRYFNIKPFEYNRVKLRVPAGELDYLNASHVKFSAPGDDITQNSQYIAMQGPTMVSLGCVWRMIAEQTHGTAVIVQLTNFFEGGQLKCDLYFPTEESRNTDTGSAPNENPFMELNLEDAWHDGWKARLELARGSSEEMLKGAVQKRKLLLKVEGEAAPRTIWHLLYTKWPDYGVPDTQDTKAFFELMKLSHQLNGPGNPRVVHCSAGVGRTGTFIALEHLMQALNDGTLDQWGRRSDSERQDYVYKVVDELRQMRKTMVQSDAQFRMLYATTKLLWEGKNGVAQAP